MACHLTHLFGSGGVSLGFGGLSHGYALDMACADCMLYDHWMLNGGVLMAWDAIGSHSFTGFLWVIAPWQLLVQIPLGKWLLVGLLIMAWVAGSG